MSNKETDVHRRQKKAYKRLRQLNKIEKDDAQLHIIDQNYWIRHYKDEDR